MGVSRRTRQRELKKNVITIMIIAVFAVIVFSINSIGNFIATKVIQPVVNFTGTKTDKILTDTLTTPKLTLYLLCAGEMPDMAEAETLKSFTIEQGGGGYIFNRDDVYYVIHSVFKDKSQAENKGQQLLDKFTPSVITLTLEETVIKVTGKSSQMKAVHSCFLKLNNIALTLQNLNEQVETGKISNLEALKELQKLKNQIEQSGTELKSLNSSNTKVLAVIDMLVLSETLLNQLPSNDAADFKQKLNFVTCAYVCEFYKFYCSLE